MGGQGRVMVEMQRVPTGKGRDSNKQVGAGAGPCGVAWGGARGISWGLRGHSNKNTRKNTGFGDWRGNKSRGGCSMVGTVIGEQAGKSPVGTEQVRLPLTAPARSFEPSGGFTLQPLLLLCSAGAASPRRRRR